MTTRYAACLLVLPLFIACGEDSAGQGTTGADSGPDSDVATDLADDVGPDDTWDAMDVEPDGVDDVPPDMDEGDADSGDGGPDVEDIGPDVVRPDNPYTMDDVLTLAHVQAKGTHNSYHLQPETPLHPSHEYSHVPLDVQLDEQGVRQFELDLHLRQGGSFEVFHIPIGDEETTCRLLVDCLATIKAWSDRNPWHMPIMIWLEPKDDIDGLLPDYDVIEGHYDQLEEEILSVWPRQRIFAPDDLRGEHSSLPEAIAADGSPTLGRLRDKVIFAMLDSVNHRDAYVDGAPALEGKLLFVDASSADEPFAAFFKINNAVSDADQVGDLGRDGFIVTSNLDGADSNDEDSQTRLEGSLAAGAHFLSTDFPAPVEGRDYWFDLPGDRPARCNPVTAPPTCVDAEIE